MSLRDPSATSLSELVARELLDAIGAVRRANAGVEMLRNRHSDPPTPFLPALTRLDRGLGNTQDALDELVGDAGAIRGIS